MHISRRELRVTKVNKMVNIQDDLSQGSTPGAGYLSRYVTSHPGVLSLAIPSWVGAMSTSQRVVTPCGWGVKAGVVRVWMASKTV